MIGRREALTIVGGCIGAGSVVSVSAQADYDVPSDTDPDGPEITAMDHDPATGPVIPDSQITLSVTAHDPQGQLDAIVFGEARNYLRVGRVPANGETDTATYTYDEAPRHMRSGYDCIAWAESTDGRVGELTFASGPVITIPIRAQFERIDDPVRAGERLEATVSVEHIGSIQDAGPVPDLHLVVGGEVVDTVSLDLDFAEETVVTVGYETYPVRQNVSFDVQLVAADTVADSATVEVYA